MRQLLPEAFSEGIIDWEKLKADYEKRVGDKDEEGYMTKDGMFKKNNKENGQYHSNELVLLLGKATQEMIDSVISEKPVKVITLDKLFKGNDQLKTNTVLQMKDAGVEFKTI